MVLLSGGLDSATALAVAQHAGFACHTLAIDYGQRHRVELRAAELVAQARRVASHRVVTLGLRAVGGSALTADVAVPKDRAADELSAGVPVTYVPARNAVFLSIAAGLAEVCGARDIYIGVNAVDYSGYPDCRREFLDAMTRALNLGTKAGSEGHSLAVHSPLDTLSKADIIRLGTRLGVDYSLTTSCYDPVAASDAGGAERRGSWRACGHCDSCQIRRRGFAEAGVPDPTLYAEAGR